MGHTLLHLPDFVGRFAQSHPHLMTMVQLIIQASGGFQEMIQPKLLSTITGFTRSFTKGFSVLE
jgi:hypothetical protein